MQNLIYYFSSFYCVVKYDQDMFLVKVVLCTLFIQCLDVCPWSTKPVLSRRGIFIAIVKKHCMGQKYQFLFYAKNH